MKKAMKLTWLGHACFRVEFDGYAIVLDPYAPGSVPGMELPNGLCANEVLCSHTHGDHGCVEAVCISASEQASPFTVTPVDTWHDDVQGAKRGPNRIHILEAGGIRLVHFGDLGCTLDAEQLSVIGRPDAALIPVGGFYTIGPKEAAVLADTLQARVTVPMHYRTEKFGLEPIGTLEEFLAFTGPAGPATFYESNTLEIGPDTPRQLAVPAYCPEVARK